MTTPSAIGGPSRRMLLVGPWVYPWYHQACASALDRLGWKVTPFAWAEDFYRTPIPDRGHRYVSLAARLQDRLLTGPTIAAINRRLLAVARQEDPAVVWFYNCTHIYPETVRQLRCMLRSALLVQYCNDNPFGDHVRPDYWRHLKRAIPHFHRHFVYRHSNIDEFRARGAGPVQLLRAYFIPEADRRLPLSAGDGRFEADVVFAGHYEHDGRAERLAAIVAAGHRLNLFGGGWARASRSEIKAVRGERGPVASVYGDDYCKAICGAKIALSFLSKRNRDTYTRRNFEIPAMQAFMLSEFSEDLASLFREGVEAEFFRSPDELLDKVRFYLAHDEARARIAAAGRARVVSDGHDVMARMRQFQQALDHA